MGDTVVFYNVTKYYVDPRSGEKIVALDDINLAIPRGKITCLLGPNGSGKTTLLKLASGLIVPDRGRVAVFGYDTRSDFGEICGKISIVFSREYIPLSITGLEYLTFFGMLYGYTRGEASRRARELLHLVGLDNKIDTLVATYSTGMVRRLYLAKALINEPKLVLFDEPTTGLDPVARLNFYSLVNNVREERDITIMWATHDLREAETVAEKIIFLNKGRIIAEGSRERFEEIFRFKGVVRVEVDSSSIDKYLIEDLKQRYGNLKARDSTLEYYYVSEDDLTGFLHLVSGKFRIANVTTSKPSLEDIYLSFFGGGP